MPGQPRKPVVFVVDADSSVLRSLGRLIRAGGFEARLFDTPARFLEEAQEVPLGCLILDIPLAHMDLAGLRRRLDQRGLQLPIIVISAYGDDATRREAKRCGARSFYRKPVDGRTLIDAIDWAVGSEPDDGEGEGSVRRGA